MGHLGCHCGTISSVSVSFGTKYYAACGGKNVKVLDTTKEEEIKFHLDHYSGVWVPPEHEVRKLHEFLKDKGPSFKEVVRGMYDGIIEKCSDKPLWIMSDVINYDAPERNPNSSGNEFIGGAALYEVFGRTRDFAQHLVDNKIGFIMASPIVQNPSHRSKRNYSLNQGWIWIPPKQLDRAINVATRVGDDQFPTQKKWIATVGEDLGIADPDTVLKQVLETGSFPQPPKQSSRFSRQRGRDGRFLPLPKIRAA